VADRSSGAPLRRIAVLLAAGLGLGPAALAQRVEIRIGAGLTDGPTTGRMFVIFTRDGSREPRLQAGSYAGSAPFYGVDVSALATGEPAVFDASTPGFPLDGLRDLPPGDYFVQGLLNVYTRVTPKHGKTIWVHWDQWEGQQWNRSPGNLVSEVERIRWDPNGSLVRLTLVRQLPPVEVPPDSRWVKRVKIQSKILSDWWGRPVHLGAVALVPSGWEQHPTTRYPAIYIQGHFGLGPPFGFSPEGAPETKEARTARLARTAREPGSEFARSWMGPNFPRMVAITLQHPTPYYDDSYAVNSANNGPYGDAIIKELIPFLEDTFRLIPRSYARLLTGGSTGGWEALALQIQHPDFFGGAWALYPDGVDFSRNQMIDNYADSNAFMPNAAPNQWLVPERYMSRGEDGQPRVSVRQMARLEEVLGSRVRGGQQLQAYDAVYGPVGDDGYPRPLFDRRTGTIDKEVAAYWRDHGYDLTHYLRTAWSRVGRHLAGKIRVYTGDMDNFYLNLAVYRMQAALDSVANPRAGAVFEYGRPMKPHGWQPFTNAELVRMMAREVARRRSAEGGG
jgi:hypothetical protein